MAFFIFSCTKNGKEENQTEFGNYGEVDFLEENALSVSEAIKQLGSSDSIETVISGTIAECCQSKGCWMNLQSGNEELFVKFKDYGFFVPMNSAEHQSIVKGYLYQDTISVVEQKHLAEDAEKSEEEIAQITTPKVEYRFVAHGVHIK